jgi:hypothetical protein
MEHEPGSNATWGPSCATGGDVRAVVEEKGRVSSWGRRDGDKVRAARAVGKEESAAA